MLTKTAEKSGYLEIIRGKNIKVMRDKAGPIHLDGEPRIVDAPVQINVVPHSLKIIVGDGYRP
jgi:diacylglycerol kinase family enzyme